MTEVYEFLNVHIAVDYREKAVSAFPGLDFQLLDNRVTITGVDVSAACTMAYHMGGDDVL